MSFRTNNAVVISIVNDRLATIQTDRIAAADERTYVGTEETGFADQVVIAASDAADASKVLANFGAATAAAAGERFDFTHALAEILLRAKNTAATGDVSIRLVPQAGGQVYVGQGLEAADGHVEVSDNSTLRLSGGTNTGTARGDLFLSGGDATGTNPAGHVLIRGGGSPSGQDGSIYLQSAAGASITRFVPVESSVNYLIVTPAVTGGDVEIESTGADADVGLVLRPTGGGLVTAPADYDMTDGPDHAFATKAYVDAYVDASAGKADLAIQTGTAVTLTDTDHIVILTHTAARTVALPVGSEGRMFIIKDGAGTAGTAPVTIDPNGSETIDGAATLVIAQNYRAVTLVWNGIEWNTL